MLSRLRTSWRSEILEPIWRFPLPVAFAVIATVVDLKVPGLPARSDNIQGALTLYCMAAFFWSWAGALWAETHSDRLRGVLIGFAGAVVLAVVFRLDLVLPLYFSGAAGGAWGPLTLSHWVLTWALTLAPSLAPYLSRRASQSAYWQYNHKWVVAFLAALLGSGLALGGIAAIIGAISLLLDVSAPGWLYSDVFLICLVLVAPWLWLTLSPTDFGEEIKTGANQEFTAHAVGLLVVYILIPVAFALSVVFAAYLVKVAATGQFATTALGETGATLGTGVILVMLMAFPQRQDHSLVRLFWRVWPFLLIAPLLLLLPVLRAGVVEDGWTPDRYYLAVLVLWIGAVMLAGIIMRRKQDLRLVPALAFGLLAVTAFGPWGVGEVTASSQYARLEALLTGKGLLAGGRWRSGGDVIPWERSQVVSSEPSAPRLVTDNDRKVAGEALGTLASAGRLDLLRPWFEGQADNPFKGEAATGSLQDRLGRVMQLHYNVYATEPAGGVLFLASEPATIPLPGGAGTLIGMFSLDNLGPRREYETTLGKVTMTIKERRVAVDLGPDQIATFDLTASMKTLGDTPADSGPAKPRMTLLLEAENGSKAQLAVTYLRGHPTLSPADVKLVGYLILQAAHTEAGAGSP